MSIAGEFELAIEHVEPGRHAVLCTREGFGPYPVPVGVAMKKMLDDGTILLFLDTHQGIARSIGTMLPVVTESVTP